LYVVYLIDHLAQCLAQAPFVLSRGHFRQTGGILGLSD